MQNYDNFINGKFTPAMRRERITCINPSTGDAICTVPDSTPADVEEAISAASAAQQPWARRPAVERAQALRALHRRPPCPRFLCRRSRRDRLLYVRRGAIRNGADGVPGGRIDTGDPLAPRGRSE